MLTTENGGQLNVKSMCIHASAFSLFAASVSIYSVFNALFLLSEADYDSKVNRAQLMALTFIQIPGFVSQILLCVIFKQLSGKREEPKNDDE